MKDRVIRWLSAALAFIGVGAVVFYFRKRALSAEKREKLAVLTKSADVLQAKREAAEANLGANAAEVAAIDAALLETKKEAVAVIRSTEGMKADAIAKEFRKLY